MKLVFTAAARADLHAIGDWIASDNAPRAVTFIDELEQHCARLADRPQMHPLLIRRESTGLRKAVHGNYLIFYRMAGDAVEIVRILHGAQDWERMLFESEGRGE
jgi:plasmid stabilization system protein ParE